MDTRDLTRVRKELLAVAASFAEESVRLVAAHREAVDWILAHVVLTDRELCVVARTVRQGGRARMTNRMSMSPSAIAR